MNATRFRRDPLADIAIWATVFAFISGAALSASFFAWRYSDMFADVCSKAGDPIACLIITAG